MNSARQGIVKRAVEQVEGIEQQIVNQCFASETSQCSSLEAEFLPRSVLVSLDTPAGPMPVSAMFEVPHVRPVRIEARSHPFRQRLGRVVDDHSKSARLEKHSSPDHSFFISKRRVMRACQSP